MKLLMKKEWKLVVTPVPLLYLLQPVSLVLYIMPKFAV